MKFFVDNNLSVEVVRGMRGFGERLVHLTEEFDPSTDDSDWLEVIGTRGWFLVTRDERVRFRPAEISAIKEHNVGAFFIGGKNRSRCELIQQIVRNWPRMKEIANSTRPPFLYRIPPKGTKYTRLPL